MNKKDKDKLIILLFLLVYVAVTVVMIKTTATIPWYLIILAMIAIEYFVAQPRLTKLFYEANGQKADNSRFIPWWNEIMIFNEKEAIASAISYIVFVVSVVSFAIPIDIVENVLGAKIALNYGVFCIRFIAIALLINSIIIGIAFSHVAKRIKDIHRKMTGGYSNISTSVVYTIFAYVPILRVITVIGLQQTLEKIVVINKYTCEENRNQDILVEEN